MCKPIGRSVEAVAWGWVGLDVLNFAKVAHFKVEKSIFIWSNTSAGCVGISTKCQTESCAIIFVFWIFSICSYFFPDIFLSSAIKIHKGIEGWCVSSRTNSCMLSYSFVVLFATPPPPPTHTHSHHPSQNMLPLSAVQVTWWQHLTACVHVSCFCCRQVDKVGKQINPLFNPQSLRVNLGASPCR